MPRLADKSLADANPAMVTLARESRALTQSELAKRIGISQGQLSKIEAGILPVAQDVLTRLASELGYPEPFFAFTDPVFGPGTSEFFHRKRQAASARVMNKIHAEINIRRMNIARFLKAAELKNSDIPRLSTDEYGSPEEVARAIRATWQLPPGPIANLIEAVENAGGIVVPCAFDTPLVDAVSRWIPGLPPLFFMNRAMPGDRQRLSLAHELGHVVMHQTPQPEMEDEAYAFASELLMPETDIRHQLIDLSLERLAALKTIWRVSMAALLRRAARLGTVTPRHERTLWMRMSKAGYRSREPGEIDIQPEHPGLLREIVALHTNEFGYTLGQVAQMIGLNEDDAQGAFGVDPTTGELRARLRVFSNVS